MASLSANNRPANISEFAERLEPTDRLATSYFGALHNDGHLLISLHDDNPSRPGSMFWEAAAVRDPVFFRWHAHIDDLFRKYQDTLDPYTFSDLPPAEIIDLAIIGETGQQNELTTEMRTRTLRKNVTGATQSSFTYQQTIEYLAHEDFTYEVTVRNDAGADLAVTVRIFLAPEQELNDRRAWIEMDKFRQSLPPGRSTFVRRSQSSSVIRHPVWTAAMLENPATGPNESGASPGCRCGWPYTLLLPRGTQAGMEFRFLVLLTPGDELVPNLVAIRPPFCEHYPRLDHEGYMSSAKVYSRDYQTRRPEN
jgi:hypothetical protein